MKIEFRKVPIQENEFNISLDSVDFLGTFSKITSTLAKIDSHLAGQLNVECCKCGESFTIEIDEKNKFLVSDGIYKPHDNDDEEAIVIEVEEHILDFDELLKSEIESLKSDYHICSKCQTSDNEIELEY